MLRCWQKSQCVKELRTGTAPLRGRAAASAHGIAWANILLAQWPLPLLCSWGGCWGGQQAAGICKLELEIKYCFPAGATAEATQPSPRRGSCDAPQHREIWNRIAELPYFWMGNPRWMRGMCSRSMCAVSPTCLRWKLEHKLQIYCLAHRPRVCNIPAMLALCCVQLNASTLWLLALRCVSQADGHTLYPKIHSMSSFLGSADHLTFRHPTEIQRCRLNANRYTVMLVERMDMWCSPGHASKIQSWEAWDALLEAG